MSAVQLRSGMWVTHKEFPEDIFELNDYDYSFSFWDMRHTSDTGRIVEVTSPCDLLTPFWAQPGDTFKVGMGVITIGNSFIKNKKDGCKIKVADVKGEWGLVSLDDMTKLEIKN